MKPDPTRRRIALFGSFGTGNLGNEATLQAMIYNLRRHLPDVEISCICPAPENTAVQYDISAAPIRASVSIWKLAGMAKREAPTSSDASAKAHVSLRPLRICAFPLREIYRWVKGIARLRGSNLLIMTGTGMLGDYAITPLGFHLDIFRWAVIAKLCRCKLAFVSVGGGPIRHPLSRFFVKMALALADYRSYRDASSKDYLRATGVDVKNDAVYPDLAFSLPIAVIPADYDPGRQGVVIGVGLMNYHDRLGRSGNDETTIYRDYVTRLASFVVRLLERGYAVRILIGDFVCDQSVRQHLRTALKGFGVGYEDSRVIDEPASSVDELLRQLASVDIVVSSRFHNLVLALMLRKPVFAISYHEKFRPLMDGVGLGEFLYDIEDFDADELSERIISLHEDPQYIKIEITRHAESYRVALYEQYERVFKLFDRPIRKGRKIADGTPARLS
jgi:polysaccharide pyruvyl transferase WcaK-like protein